MQHQADCKQVVTDAFKEAMKNKRWEKILHSPPLLHFDADID